jgi:hypothetical protein
MSENVKVALYGTRTAVVNKPKSKSKQVRARAPTPKKYVQIASDDYKNAKAFHAFYRKTPRSKWIRLTDDLEVFPSIIRSVKDKTEYHEMLSNYLIDVYFPKKKAPPKIPKPPKPPKIPKEPKEREVFYVTPKEPERAELELPGLPAEPRITPVKGEVIPKLALIIFDELSGRGYFWPKARINNMINKLWKGFRHHPHLLLSDDFRRSIVVKEILDQSKEERLAGHKDFQEKFRQELAEKEISLDPEIVGGTVKVQLKEVFNKFNLKKDDKDAQTIEMYDPTTLKHVQIDRQIMFVQVVTEYDEFIQVNKDDIESGQEMLNIAVDKVKRDVTKIFTEALEKGIFSFDNNPQYSVRLITPMIDVRGEIPDTYLDRDGNKTSGHGFSTSRMEVRNLDDLDDLLNELFDDLPKILARYVALNNAMGVGFTGFVIERILR